MKEYKLKINGNDYNVVINDVQDSTASVEVNGSTYSVEFEKPLTKSSAAKPVVKKVTPAAAPAAKPAAAAPAASSAPAGGVTVPSPLPGVILEISVKEGDAVKFEEVLAVSDDGKLTVNPQGASVEATVEAHGKDKKIIVYKYKPKKGYHKKQGHRQPYTKVKIEKINL